jgi:hypothetical protein
MKNPYEDQPPAEELLTTEEVADLLRVSTRKVLLLPLRQVRLGPRSIRFRLWDVYEFLGVENPNL